MLLPTQLDPPPPATQSAAAASARPATSATTTAQSSGRNTPSGGVSFSSVEHTCPVCKRGFGTRQALSAHKRYHVLTAQGGGSAVGSVGLKAQRRRVVDEGSDDEMPEPEAKRKNQISQQSSTPAARYTLR